MWNWLEAMEYTSSQTSFKSWQWRWGHLLPDIPDCLRLPRVSSSFPSFLNLCLLYLSSCSFAVTKDFATLLLSSDYSITWFSDKYRINCLILKLNTESGVHEVYGSEVWRVSRLLQAQTKTKEKLWKHSFSHFKNIPPSSGLRRDACLNSLSLLLN